MCGSRVVQVVCVAVVFSGAIYGRAAPEDPALPLFPDVVQYNVRDDPNDPSSPVVWTVELDVRAQEADGNSVGWLIDSVRVSEIDQQGEPVSLWVDASPEVDSPDGLWWIEHSDAGNPELVQFAMPPLLTGTATVQLGGQDDLDYTLEGVPYTPVPGSPLSELLVTGLDYVFTLVGESVPLDEGDDEPVEVPPSGTGGGGA